MPKNQTHPIIITEFEEIYNYRVEIIFVKKNGITILCIKKGNINNQPTLTWTTTLNGIPLLMYSVSLILIKHFSRISNIISQFSKNGQVY